MHGTILVTGAAGFIGSSLVDSLLRDGHRVIGVDNFDPFYARDSKLGNLQGALRHPQYAMVEDDVAHLDAINARVPQEPIDAIVHLAAKAGVRPSIQDPIAYAHANVTGTQSMLEFAKIRGIRRFVLASSSSVYGDDSPSPFREGAVHGPPLSPYAATKRAAELLGQTAVHLQGLSLVALRFFTVYGPRQRPDLAIRKFAERILRGEPIEVFGDGSTARDYTWIDDIVDGIRRAIDFTGNREREFHAINLGESETTTLAELVELLESATGRRAARIVMPAQPGDVRRTFADISVARDLLGYAPTTKIHEGIPRFVEWLRRGVTAP